MNHDFISVKKVFEKYKIIYVPYYQRDYVWGQKNDGRNLYKFIDDIFSQYNENPTSDYFIGTLAFCSARTVDVIDGQQRLTSLVLILSKLAELKCSSVSKKKNKKILEPDEGKFVIQDDFYLTEELKHNLGLNDNYNSQNYSVDISSTIDKIVKQINNDWSGYTETWYDRLYDFILNNVKLISLEYSNISESLKYFLNINSLSVQLTQSEIFFSILSQSIRLARTGDNIFTIKKKVADLGKLKGIDNKDIDGYKGCDDNKEKGINNVIYIFLNAYYKGESNVDKLGDAGIGKWMSFYRNEVFNDAIKAKEFTEKFTQYLEDFDKIYSYFSNKGDILSSSSSLYITWILLQYENYFDIARILTDLFEHRHNYKGGLFDLYVENTKTISQEKIEVIGKRINLILLWNYIRSNTKRTVGIIEGISIDDNGNYKKTVDDILIDINVNEIFNLTYNDHKNVAPSNLKDYSKLIKVIMGCQEAFLDKTANSSRDFGEYLQNILDGENFSIEHLYSVLEYQENARLANWKEKKSKFNRPEDFDAERFKFDNLSLLDKSMNSSAGSDKIKAKLLKYKQARKIIGSNWEYLIQSFAEDSEYYRNTNIQNLGLPERKLINIDQNTWELSPNNREFNTMLLKMALKEIADK